MSHWNLRRVKDSPESRARLCEVYYDEENRPWSYADASLRTKLRFWREAFKTPVLTWQKDFTGELDLGLSKPFDPSKFMPLDDLV